MRKTIYEQYGGLGNSKKVHIAIMCENQKHVNYLLSKRIPGNYDIEIEPIIYMDQLRGIMFDAYVVYTQCSNLNEYVDIINYMERKGIPEKVEYLNLFNLK